MKHRKRHEPDEWLLHGTHPRDPFMRRIGAAAVVSVVALAGLGSVAITAATPPATAATAAASNTNSAAEVGAHAITAAAPTPGGTGFWTVSIQRSRCHGQRGPFLRRRVESSAQGPDGGDRPHL